MSVELDGANNVVKTDTVSEVTSANGVTIDGLSIKDSKLVTANSVIEANMSANSVDSDSYVDGSIDTAHIADLNVTEGKIAADAITAAKIADNAVVTAGINADAVTGAEIADDAINSEHYTDGSIDTAHIAATQVTGAKLNNDVISAQTALAAEPDDTDEFLVSDAGTLKRIDYSLIKPIWKLLQTQTASTDSAITFSSTYITTAHDVYKIFIHSLLSSSDNDAIRISAAVNNSTFNLQGNGALSAFITDETNFTVATNQPGAAGSIAIGFNISDTATEAGYNTEITIYSPMTNTETIVTLKSGIQNAADKYVHEDGIIHFNQGAINAFRFGCNSGTTTGTFSLYGLVK